MYAHYATHYAMRREPAGHGNGASSTEAGLGRRASGYCPVMPRKPLPEDELRTKITTIRLDQEEYRILKRAAELACAGSLAVYIRDTALNHSKAVLAALDRFLQV